MADKYQEAQNLVEETILRLNEISQSSVDYPRQCANLIDALEVLRDSRNHERAAFLRQLAETCKHLVVSLVLDSVARNIAKNAVSLG
ncbi:hypothetical protein KKC32_05130 [Patescibacteria group bacterium]|nr:hypothetical protein [Patescibacteria group bacterium]